MAEWRPPLIPLSDITALVGHRYLDDSCFSSFARQSEGRLGTPLSLERIMAMPMQASELHFLTQSLDEELARRAVDVDIRLVFTVDGKSPAAALVIDGIYCISLDIILGFRCFQMAVVAFYSEPCVENSRRADAPHRDAIWVQNGGPKLCSISEVDVSILDVSTPEFLVCQSGASLMIFSIVCHELAHILNGHVGWSYAEETHRDALTSRTLEYDADCSALLMQLMFWSTPFVVSQRDAGVIRLSQQGAQGIFYMFWAWRLIELLSVKPFDPDHSIHPDPCRRMHTLILVLMEYAAREARLDDAEPKLDALCEQAMDIIGLIEQIHRIAFESPSRLIPYLRDIGGEIDAEEQAIYRRWEQLRPSLVRHQVGKHNLAPAWTPPA